jgi:hypothetical protein
VLEELKSMLLNELHSDAFKGQCLRVMALIISTNYPPGKAAAVLSLINRSS